MHQPAGHITQALIITGTHITSPSILFYPTKHTHTHETTHQNVKGTKVCWYFFGYKFTKKVSRTKKYIPTCFFPVHHIRSEWVKMMNILYKMNNESCNAKWIAWSWKKYVWEQILPAHLHTTTRTTTTAAAGILSYILPEDDWSGCQEVESWMNAL